mmetsp:Transcript_26344/g.47751  ORF Transcript_26344/g.47751 Transcript_26344/m.47751 type:complete len:416 (+) Transcript_26344:200-1447(+)
MVVSLHIIIRRRTRITQRRRTIPRRRRHPRRRRPSLVTSRRVRIRIERRIRSIPVLVARRLVNHGRRRAVHPIIRGIRRRRHIRIDGSHVGIPQRTGRHRQPASVVHRRRSAVLVHERVHVRRWGEHLIRRRRHQWRSHRIEVRRRHGSWRRQTHHHHLWWRRMLQMRRHWRRMYLLLLLLLLLHIRVTCVVLLIGLPLVTVLFFRVHLLPCVAHNTSHRPAFRGNASVVLLQFQYMFGEEDVVSRLGAFAVVFFGGGVVGGFFLEAIFVRFRHFIIPRLLLGTQLTPSMPTVRNITRGRYPLQLGPAVRILQRVLVRLRNLRKSLSHEEIIPRQLLPGSALVLPFAFVGLLSFRNKSAELGTLAHEQFVVMNLAIQFGFECLFQVSGGDGEGDDFLVSDGVGSVVEGLGGDVEV